MREISFKPAWWLRNPHLQTLWPTMCRRKIRDLPLKRERFELPDGDFIDLDWLIHSKGRPLVLILHGLEGSVESPYAKGMLRAIYQQGWSSVFMHFRGCSGEPNRLPRCYHSADTGDLAIVIKALREREPQIPLAAIGFSLGGNVLLKWLGEMGQSSPLSAGVAVSVPFELHKAADRIKHGFSRVYQWYLLNCMCNRLRLKFQNQPSPIDISLLKKVQTMWEFDDHITAPLHGFLCASDYYEIASSRQYISAIRTPTLLLQAKDDPFMTEDVIPGSHELSEQVKLEVTENGGHVGFVSGTFPWQAQYWLEQRIPLYLKDYLS